MILHIKHVRNKKSDKPDGVTMFLVANGMLSYYKTLEWNLIGSFPSVIKEDFEFVKYEVINFIETHDIEDDEFYLDVEEIYELSGLPDDEKEEEIEQLKADEKDMLIDYINNYTLKEFFEDVAVCLEGFDDEKKS